MTRLTPAQLRAADELWRSMRSVQEQISQTVAEMEADFALACEMIATGEQA